MPDTLKIAAAQYPIDEPASPGAWREKIARWVEDGAATGADLLIFPEYAAIEQAAAFGRSVSGDLAATLDAVARAAPERVSFHIDLARENDVHILAGSGPVRKPDGRVVNAAQLIAPNGSIGEQEKIIMTPFERDWGVSPGGPLRVFETALGRIGVAICYDCEFPLIARALAVAGAELLLAPSCTESVPGYHRVRTGAMARALENGIAVATSPTIGDAPWSPAVDRNTGAAGVFLPSEPLVCATGVLAEGKLNEPGWVTASIDLAALRRLRAGGEMRNFADWGRQPGAAAAASVEIVTLV